MRAVFYSPFLVHAIRSISRVLSSTAIYLDPGLLLGSSHLLGTAGPACSPTHGVAPDRVYSTPMFPWGGCALTTPFHPYLAGTNQGAHTPNEAVSFCCTCPRVTPGGRYPLSLPCGARTFLMRGLSALRPRLSDPVAHVLYFICRKKSNRLQFLSHADIIQAGIFSERLWI